MAGSHGKHGRVLIGRYNLSPYLRDFSNGQSLDVAEVSTLGKNSKEYVVGLGDGTLGLSGLYDGAAGAIDAMLVDLRSTESPVPFTLAPQGVSTVGNRANFGEGYINSYEISGGMGDAVQTSVEMQVHGAMFGGVVLADLAQRNATSQTTGIDHGATSSLGLDTVLQVTEFTGLTNIVKEIQHSTDSTNGVDGTWTDRLTFTTVTSTVTTHTQKTSTTNSTNRWWRVLWTVTGTGTCTFTVVAKRRN